MVKSFIIALLIAILLAWNIQAGVNSYLNTPREVTISKSLDWLSPDWRDPAHLYQEASYIYLDLGEGRARYPSILIVSPREAGTRATLPAYQIASWNLEENDLEVVFKRNLTYEMVNRALLLFTGLVFISLAFLYVKREARKARGAK